MKSSKDILIHQARRAKRARAKVRGDSLHPRLSVFRSNRHISAQLIDDEKRITIVSVADSEIADGTKKGAARPVPLVCAEAVGVRLAEKALKKQISEVRFDRGRYRYHGLVAALAAGARRGGLRF